MPNNHSINKIAVLIFAQNESDYIQSAVNMVNETVRNGDCLFVIADSCTDNTAQLAEEAGARVIVRDQLSPNGKGAAIAWFIEQQYDLIKEYSHVVILDADSKVEKNFLSILDDHLNDDFLAGQCKLCPVDYESTHVSKIIALSEILEQSVFDHIRSSLGWSVRLRGTGMVFKLSALKEISDRIETNVEDVVLSLMLTEKNITIKPISHAIVYDPKPIVSDAASKQRARWFRGQWAAFWRFRFSILRILLKGPGGWSMISSLFFKPRWLEMTLLTLLGFIFIRFPIISAIFFGLVILQAILIVYGIFQLRRKWMFLEALLYVPIFILMWIKGIFISLRQSHWLSARSQTLPDDE